MSSRSRSEEHTSELQSLRHLVCRLLLEKKIKRTYCYSSTASLACVFSSTRPVHDDPPTPRSTVAAPWPSPSMGSGVQVLFFFFNETAPPEIYPLPLPAALPI